MQRPWKAHGEAHRVQDVAAFAEPGWVKIAMGPTATPDGDGALLVTETRIAATSDDARRAFGRYWLAVRLGSDLVRVVVARRRAAPQSSTTVPVRRTPARL